MKEPRPGPEKTVTSAAPPNERFSADPAKTKKPLILEALGGLLGTANILILITAALYFWGHAYYSGFCEYIGLPFQGVSLSVQEYLVASWVAVFYLLLGIGLALIAFQSVVEIGEAVSRRWLKRRKSREAEDTRSNKAPLYFIVGGGVIVTAFIILLGAMLMLQQGKNDAEKILKYDAEIIIRANDGKPIPGHFAFYRDFGSTLLVGEKDANGDAVVGYRFIKSTSYSDYTILRKAKPNP